MDRKIKRMYMQDVSAIIVAMGVLWFVIGYAMLSINPLVQDRTITLGIMFVGMMACAFGTASLVALFMHLKNNKYALYIKEILSDEVS